MPVDSLDCTISSLTDPASLEARWRALEAITGPPFFLTWDWMGPWLSLTTSPLYLCEVRQGEQDVGLAILGAGRQRIGPLSFQTIYLNQSGNPEEDRVFIEYNGILCSYSSREAVWESFLTSLTTFRSRLPAELKSWSLLQLSGLKESPKDTGSFREFLPLRHQSQQAYLVDFNILRNRSESFLDSLSANTRGQISRARRILAEDGNISFQVAKARDQVEVWLPEMATIQAWWFATKAQSAALSRPFFYDFLTRLVLGNLKSGSVEFIQCKAGHQTIGYLVNLRSGRRVYSYQSAFAQYDDNKIKPGLVCHAMMADHYLIEGADHYDLLAGDSQYKVSLSNKTQSLDWSSLGDRSVKMRALVRLKNWLG